MSMRDALSLSALSDRDRRAIVLGLAVLVPALLWVAAVRPYRVALQDLRDRAATERALLAREEAVIADADEMPARLAAATERDRLAVQRLVQAPNQPLAEAELTSLLESIASASRVLLQDMRSTEPRTRPGDDVAWTSIRPLRLSVRGESDLEGAMTFLHRVENGPVLMRITELTIEPADDGVVRFAMLVEAYTSAEEVAS